MQDRSNSDFARKVVERMFIELPGGCQRGYLEFLASSIEHLAQYHPDRWAVTLYSNLIRLNSGMVECLVLHANGLRVLVERSSAPLGAEFEERQVAGQEEAGDRYVNAPGCAMVGMQLSDIPAKLLELAHAHHSALSITALKQAPKKNVRNAHSSGVTKFLSEVLGRQVPNPASNLSLDVELLAHLDEELQADSFEEGARTSVLVDRIERNQAARAACISYYGLKCSVCQMSFYERYGEAMKSFIHVHHLELISGKGGLSKVDPINDLRPVCPNCHAFIHQTKPPIHPDDARANLAALRSLDL